MKRKKIIITILITLISIALTSQPVRVLKVHDLQIRPNPFTPYSVLGIEPEARGVEISFDVETPSTFIWITARVFNVNGELVRAIYELEPMYSTYQPLSGDYSERADFEDRFDVVFYWDGRTDSGKIANNGRYLLHLSISDGENQAFRTEKLKTLVLIK